MLDLAQQVLDGTTDREDAERERSHFDHDVDVIEPRDPDGLSACAGLAAVATLGRALYGDDDAALPDDVTEEDLDEDAWEAP